jgi:iron complex transport system ATP-binding protein
VELTRNPAGDTPCGTVLECRNIKACRGRNLVFDGLDLAIARGENTAILGPNGSGKSTLMKLVSREIYPVHEPGSTLLLYGRERWNVEELRSRLGIVSNDLQQEYLRGSLGRDVILSGYYSSIDTWPHQQFGPAEFARTEGVMERLGVSGLARRPFGEMSTGQQRRFLLGRALVHEPEALLLDEPTSGLDLAATFRYLDTVRKLMRSGTQLILVTHHLHEIPPEVTRVVFMREGRIVAEGDKRELMTPEPISDLFGFPVQVLESNGFFQTVPDQSYPTDQ